MNPPVYIPRGPDDPAGLFNQPILTHQGFHALLYQATWADRLTILVLLLFFGWCAWIGLKMAVGRNEPYTDKD